MTGILASAGVLTGPVITATPSDVSGESPTSSVTTDAVTISTTPAATAWSWSKLSGGDIVCNSPSAATTTFSATGMASFEERTAIYVCAVTMNGSVYTGPEVGVFVGRTS